MLEKALRFSPRYLGLLTLLTGIALVGAATYYRQATEGLTITGLSRDVPWGFYIAQFTFLVGVAASAVMVVLPYYLHDFKTFGRIVILGELLAIPAVIMCMLFIIVDMGQPARLMNIILYPTPTSPMFWDMLSLLGYLVLNLVIAFTALDAERRGAPPPKWVRPFIYLSIPWAVSIHTVTAFLYCGLQARQFWLTAILAPRFLASAFAAGPSILIMLSLLLRRYTRFDAGKPAIEKLGQIVTYAMIANVFFVLIELFTVLYGAIPSHVHHFSYLYLGNGGTGTPAPFMMLSAALAVTAVIMLVFPRIRRNETTLVIACAAVVASLWIDKGLGMIVGGFVPSPLGHYTEYRPTGAEVTIGLGIYALGGLILTILYKIAITVREETEGGGPASHVSH